MKERNMSGYKDAYQNEELKNNRELQIKSMKKKGTFLAVGLFILAVLFAIISGVQVAACTEKVTAVVTEIKSKTEWVHRGSRSSRVRTVYAPVFEFTYNGTEYTASNGLYSKNQTFKVGQEVEIYIDPDDPRTLYVAGERTVFVKGVIFLIMLGLGFYFLLSVLPGKMQQKNGSAGFDRTEP